MPPKKSSKQQTNVNPAIAKRNQEIDDTIRADLLKLDKEGLIQYLWNFRREWCMVSSTDHEVFDIEMTPIKVFDMILKNFGATDNSDISLTSLDTHIKSQITKGINLFHALQSRQMLDPERDVMETTHLTQLLGVIHYAKKMIEYFIKTQEVMDPNFTGDDELLSVLDKFKPICFDENTKFQNLLLYLLNETDLRNYKRYGEDCYKERYVDGFFTHSWERVSSIEEFVYNSTKKEYQFEQWKNLTHSAGNARSATEYLTKCNEIQFPVLKKDRHVFSFKNGIYTTLNINEDTTSQTKYYDHFYKYTDPIPAELVACKYFDHDMPDVTGISKWYDIPTPHLQSIFDYQEFPEAVCKTFYGMMGRLMFETGELDGWQVIPFLKGAAASGKSTLINKVCGLFYEEADIGVLSNNIEKQFGLGALCDKLLILAPELKDDFKMEQAEFQSFVSGENMQVATKHKNARTIEWKAPGILGGNQTLSFSDNAGSISRRLVVFEFEKTVDEKKGDMKLGEKLGKEIPSIIIKCVKAYLSMVNQYGDRNVWMHLPQYFKTTRDEMHMATNGLENFITSGKVKLEKGLYCKREQFLRECRTHCAENGFPFLKFTKDFYTPPFGKHGLSMTRGTKQYPIKNGEKQTSTWVEGCDFIDEDETGGNSALDKM